MFGRRRGVLSVLLLGLTLEFLSYEILEIFKRDEFCISRKNALCFAKFRVSRNWLQHAKESFVCFVFLETEHLAYETKLQIQTKKDCSLQLKLASFKSRSLLSGIQLFFEDMRLKRLPTCTRPYPPPPLAIQSCRFWSVQSGEWVVCCVVSVWWVCVVIEW